MSIATRIATERRSAAISAVAVVFMLAAILFLVGNQAYQFCMTAEQYSPFMGYIGVALPCVAVILAFGIGFVYAKMES